ncbi:fungal-specific transcription factor domain-containing protein [Schizophyllum fasciatum]
MHSVSRGSSHHSDAQDAPSPSSERSPNAFAARPDKRPSRAGSLDPSADRRKKPDRACDACRRRKTRCDGPSRADNVCSSCRQLKKNCTYMESSKPRGPPKAYITGLEDRLERMEGLLRRLRPDIDLQAEFGPPVPRDSWRTEAASGRDSPRHPSRPGAPSSAHDATFRPPAAPSVPSAAPGSSRLPLRLGNASDGESGPECYTGEAAELTIEDVCGGVRLSLPSTDAGTGPEDRNARFMGKASGAPWIFATRKFKDLHINESNAPPSSSALKLRTEADKSQLRRREFWAPLEWEVSNEGHDNVAKTLEYVQEQLPPHDLIQSLFDLYFTHTNALIPLLHRPTFERQWRAGLHKRNIWFAAVCFAIFAVASRWSHDLRVVPESCVSGADGPMWHAAGAHWYHTSMGIIVKRHRTLITPASLHEIQLFTLQSMYMRGSDFFSSGWLKTAIGAVKAQDIGAHRQSIYKDLKPADRELWKRAWWSLIVFDRLESANHGRPCTTREEDFDVDLLAEVDDEYWETGNPDTDFKQPPDQPSKITAFNLMIKLSGIVARTLRTVYSLDKVDMPLGPFAKAVDRVVSQLNSSLTDWVASVPDHLKPNRIDNPVFANQAAFLFTNYYATQMLIYRPFIPRTPTSVEQYSRNRACPYPAMAICLNAAKACVGIIQNQLPNGYSYVPNLTGTAYLAAGTLLLGYWDLKARERLAAQGVKDARPDAGAMNQLLAHYRTAVQALEWAVARWPHVAPMIEHVKGASPSTDDLQRPLGEFDSRLRASTPRSHVEEPMPAAPAQDHISASHSTAREWPAWKRPVAGPSSNPPSSTALGHSSGISATPYFSQTGALRPGADRPQSFTDDSRRTYTSSTPYANSPAGSVQLTPWSDILPFAGPRSASPADMEEAERPVAISSLRRSGSHAQLRYGSSSSAQFNESYARGPTAGDLQVPLHDPHVPLTRRTSLGLPNQFLPSISDLQPSLARRSMDITTYDGRISPFGQFEGLSSGGRLVYEPIPAFEARDAAAIYDKPRLQVQTSAPAPSSMSSAPRPFEDRYDRSPLLPSLGEGFGVPPDNMVYDPQEGSWPLPNIAARGHTYTNYRPPSEYPSIRGHRL